MIIRVIHVIWLGAIRSKGDGLSRFRRSRPFAHDTGADLGGGTWSCHLGTWLQTEERGPPHRPLVLSAAYGYESRSDPRIDCIDILLLAVGSLTLIGMVPRTPKHHLPLSSSWKRTIGAAPIRLARTVSVIKGSVHHSRLAGRPCHRSSDPVINYGNHLKLMSSRFIHPRPVWGLCALFDNAIPPRPRDRRSSGSNFKTRTGLQEPIAGVTESKRASDLIFEFLIFRMGSDTGA